MANYRGPMSMDEIVSSMERNIYHDTAECRAEGSYGFMFEELSQGGHMITGINKGKADLLLPKTFCGKPVLRIGANAFANLNLRTVVIPEGVGVIDSGAFKNCTDLVMLDIPASVHLIEKGAFEGCRNLKTIFVANKKVAKQAKKVAGNLAGYVRVKKPSDGTVGLQYAQHKDGSYILESGLRAESADVVVPEFFGGKKVSMIWDKAFYESERLRSVVIPASVTTISSNAFVLCENLERIVVEKGNKSYYSDANCLIEKSTKNLIKGNKQGIIPKGVTSIGFLSFCGLKNVERIDIPKGVTSIGDASFAYCPSLKTVILPETVKTLGEDVFANSSADIVIYTANNAVAKLALDTLGHTYATKIRTGMPMEKKR